MYTFVFNLSAGTHASYQDGQLTGSGALSGTYGTVSRVNVGGYYSNCADAASGSTFDDTVIYDRALSQAEIQALYNSQ